MLQNADVKACLSDLHGKHVFVSADKAPNNIIIICRWFTKIEQRRMSSVKDLFRKIDIYTHSWFDGHLVYLKEDRITRDCVN